MLTSEEEEQDIHRRLELCTLARAEKKEQRADEVVTSETALFAIVIDRDRSNVAAALVKTQGPSEMDRAFCSRSTQSLPIVGKTSSFFQAAHTGPSPNVKQDLR